MPTDVRCTRHPETPTNLRCGSCRDTICPRCLVHSHVGVRCPDCGRVVTPPTYQADATYLARAAAAAVAVGAAAGLVYALLFSVSSMLGGVILAGIGYLVSEAATAAANRKRGRPIQYAAGAGMIACLAAIVIVGRSLDIWVVLGVIAAILIGIARLREED